VNIKNSRTLISVGALLASAISIQAHALVMSDIVAEPTPWVVLISEQNLDPVDDATACTGTLIAPQWVLTTSRCALGAGYSTNPTVLSTDLVDRNQYRRIARGSYDSPRRVLLNTTNLAANDGESVNVIETITHPLRDIDRNNSNQTLLETPALLKLEQPVNFPTASIAELDENVLETSWSEGTVYGWGRSIALEMPEKTLGPIVDSRMRTAPVTIQRIGFAQARYTNAMGTGSCFSDAGGPLMATHPGTGEDVVYGIQTSALLKNCSGDIDNGGRSDRRVIRIQRHAAWINSIIGNAPAAYPEMLGKVRTRCYGGTCEAWIENAQVDGDTNGLDSVIDVQMASRGKRNAKTSMWVEFGSNSFISREGFARFRLSPGAKYVLTARMRFNSGPAGEPRVAVLKRQFAGDKHATSELPRRAYLDDVVVGCKDFTCTLAGNSIYHLTSGHWIVEGENFPADVDVEFDEAGEYNARFIGKLFDGTRIVRNYTITIVGKDKPVIIDDVRSGKITDEFPQIVFGRNPFLNDDMKIRLILKASSESVRLRVQRQVYVEGERATYEALPGVKYETLENGDVVATWAGGNPDNFYRVAISSDEDAQWTLHRTYEDSSTYQ